MKSRSEPSARSGGERNQWLRVCGAAERQREFMITTIVIVLVIYFAAMVGIGFMGRDKASNFEGYLSMGRSAGILLLMGGAIGGQIGNGFVVGGAAEGSNVGMAGCAYGIACALSTVLVACS